jgi:hypothetical protein
MENIKMKYLLLVLLILFFSFGAFGQDWLNGVTYQISFPLSDTKDFTNKTSFRGVGLDFRKFVKQNVTVGLAADWNVFHEVTDELIDLNTVNPDRYGDVSGTQNRIVNAFPILATAHYYFGRENMFNIGLGVGTYYVKNRLEIGVVAINSNNWHFGLAPEIGFKKLVGYTTNFFVSAKYNYAFKTKEIQPSYVALRVGFLWEIL